MSATEWLNFISPFISVLLTLNLLAGLPFSLKKPREKRVIITLVLFAFAIVGWALAWLATQVLHYPLIRVNVRDASKVMLVPTLIGLLILFIKRLFYHQEIITLVFKKLGKFLRPTFEFLALIIPTIATNFIKEYSKHAENEFINGKDEDEHEKIKKHNERWYWYNKDK